MQQRRYGIKKNYGITVEQYNQKKIEQNNLCAICKQPETLNRIGKPQMLSVDHNHNTGQIRGLLCNNCNSALGFTKDSYDIIQAMLKYVEKWRLVAINEQEVN